MDKFIHYSENDFFVFIMFMEGKSITQACIISLVYKVVLKVLWEITCALDCRSIYVCMYNVKRTIASIFHCGNKKCQRKLPRILRKSVSPHLSHY